ncbi:hypothetical protein ES703_59255 [subsurface metagenome]
MKSSKVRREVLFISSTVFSEILTSSEWFNENDEEDFILITFPLPISASIGTGALYSSLNLSGFPSASKTTSLFMPVN